MHSTYGLETAFTESAVRRELSGKMVPPADDGVVNQNRDKNAENGGDSGQDENMHRRSGKRFVCNKKIQVSRPYGATRKR